MIGVDIMNMKEKNIAILSAIPESEQQQIFVYLTENFIKNPFQPKSEEEILNELAQSRADYERGDYMDFDDAIDEICKKYGL